MQAGKSREPKNQAPRARPVSDALSSLHTELLQGSLEAAEQTAVILLPLLLREFHRRFPSVDPELVHDAVVDEISFYISHPDDVQRINGVTIERVIAGRARRRLCNRIRGNVRRQCRERAWSEQFNTS
jgi:hypothetical protein